MHGSIVNEHEHHDVTAIVNHHLAMLNQAASVERQCVICVYSTLAATLLVNATVQAVLKRDAEPHVAVKKSDLDFMASRIYELAELMLTTGSITPKESSEYLAEVAKNSA